jgi:peptidoglycan/xylan/chitin deacetylase (PgdA/CDA1 family)
MKTVIHKYKFCGNLFNQLKGGAVIKRGPFLFIMGLLMLGSPVNSQTIAPPYAVGTWRGFRNAAISFTFDDGCPNQYSIAIPMFNEFGIKMTLFIVTGSKWVWPADWAKLRNAAADGHEIASHTITHNNFNGMSDSLQKIELGDSQEEINAHIPGNKCITMAYPFCVPGNGSIAAQFYIAARICSGIIEPSTPSDFMRISSITIGTEGPVKTTKDFISTFKSAVYSKGWCVFMLHGIDNDGGWSSVNSSVLRETLEYLSENSGDYWVSTFGDIVRYIKERDSASVTETSVKDTGITLQITDTLPDSIYSYPITLRRVLPDGWISATVAQNNLPVKSRVLEINAVKYIQFDVVPDGGVVVITKRNSTKVQAH